MLAARSGTLGRAYVGSRLYSEPSGSGEGHPCGPDALAFNLLESGLRNPMGTLQVSRYKKVVDRGDVHPGLFDER